MQSLTEVRLRRDANWQGRGSSLLCGCQYKTIPLADETGRLANLEVDGYGHVPPLKALEMLVANKCASPLFLCSLSRGL